LIPLTHKVPEIACLGAWQQRISMIKIALRPYAVERG
jgi:hypothetical protein